MKKIIDLICNELDWEILLYLPNKYKSKIEEVCKMIIKNYKDNNWKAKACLDFIKMYDIYNPMLKIYHNYPRMSIIIELSSYHKGRNVAVHKQLRLKNILANKKSEIDTFINSDPEKEKYYAKVTTVLDQFADYRRRLKKEMNMPYVTNAFLKCWEMIHDYKLIPHSHQNFRVFCNAEFPGAFIFAIHRYISTQTDHSDFEWYGNSLWPGSDAKGNILGDEFGLYKKYKQKWLMDDKTYNGDVTTKKTIDHIYNKIGESIDLYTSDIGIALDTETFNLQEELETPLNLGQIICGLVSLREGGSLVCKMFMFFTPFNISLLATLNGMFNKFYISKPITSRPGNSEIYIIGKGYKGYNESKTKIERMKTCLFNWNKTVGDDTLLDQVKESFYLKMIDASYEIYQRQIRYVDLNIKIANYLYQHHQNPIYTYMTVDHNIIKGTVQSLADEIQHRRQIVLDWKRRYRDDILHKPILNPL